MASRISINQELTVQDFINSPKWKEITIFNNETPLKRGKNYVLFWSLAPQEGVTPYELNNYIKCPPFNYINTTTRTVIHSYIDMHHPSKDTTKYWSITVNEQPNSTVIPYKLFLVLVYGKDLGYNLYDLATNTSTYKNFKLFEYVE